MPILVIYSNTAGYMAQTLLCATAFTWINIQFDSTEINIHQLAKSKFDSTSLITGDSLIIIIAHNSNG